MMTQRELIIQRLEEILRASGAFDTVARNELIEDESSGRLALLFDGEVEPVANTGEGRARELTRWARPTRLMPELILVTPYGVRPVDIGTWRSWVLAKVNFLFMTDAALLALLYERDPVAYEGAVTGELAGRSLAGWVAPSYVFTYVEKFADPGAEPTPTPDLTEPP